jgi:bifunctional enzyme CysN/CysC
VGNNWIETSPIVFPTSYPYTALDTIVTEGSETGVDHNDRHEHIRRLAEVAHLMLDAGMILIVTAIDLTQKELELMKTTVDSDCIHTVWVGKEPPSNIQCDIVIEDPDLMENAIALLTSAISQKGLMR